MRVYADPPTIGMKLYTPSGARKMKITDGEISLRSMLPDEQTPRSRRGPWAAPVLRPTGAASGPQPPKRVPAYFWVSLNSMRRLRRWALSSVSASSGWNSPKPVAASR